MKTLRFLAMAAMAMATPAWANTDNAHGLWLTANGKAIVEMAPCGSQTCGRMVWVANPRDAGGKLKLDVNNEDPVKQARPICGMQLIGGMKLSGTGIWKNGWIYNPRNGKTYGAEIKAVSAAKLKVRGYLGISLLGESQTWTRVFDKRGGC